MKAQQASKMPTRKLLASVIGAVAAGWVMYGARKLGFALPEGFEESLAVAIAGLIGGIAGYLVPPSQRDQIKKKE